MTLCRAVFWIFALLYFLALALFLVGTFGLFGQEKDPLSGVFLIPLGLPWNHLLDFLPDIILAWAVAAAPIVNLILLRVICAMLTQSGRAS